MYESLREHFDVVLAIMLAAVIALHAMIRARFVSMENKLKKHDDRIATLEKSEGEGFETVLAEIKVVRAELKAGMSELRAFVAENYRRRNGNDGGDD